MRRALEIGRRRDGRVAAGGWADCVCFSMVTQDKAASRLPIHRREGPCGRFADQVDTAAPYTFHVSHEPVTPKADRPCDSSPVGCRWPGQLGLVFLFLFLWVACSRFVDKAYGHLVPGQYHTWWSLFSLCERWLDPCVVLRGMRMALAGESWPVLVGGCARC